MEYPGPNDGAWPIDASTPVGQLRFALGDVVGEEYTPPEPGRRNFEAYSDDELDALLKMAGGSFSSAIGYAYLKLAGLAAGQAIDWRSDDLAVNMSKTPAELRALAQMWFDRGSVEDSVEGFYLSGEFDSGGCGCVPELAVPAWCGCGRW